MKPATKNITSLDKKDEPSLAINNQNIETTIQNKNINVPVNSEKTSLISKTSHTYKNTNAHSKSDIKIDVTINNKIPSSNKTNIKIGEKQNYRCIC